MNKILPSKVSSKVSDDAVLLIPDPEHESESPPYGVKPGYYSREQMLDLLDLHKESQAAVSFIADMLETGSPDDDGFCNLLRSSCHDPVAIARIVRICR